MNEADLLVVVGASFSNHTGIAPYKPIVQIDDDHAAIGRFHPVDVGVLGDAAVTLTALASQLGDTPAIDQRSDLVQRWSLWRAEKARRTRRHLLAGCLLGRDLRRAQRRTARPTR